MPTVSVPLVKETIIAKVKKAAAFVGKEAYNGETSLYDSVRVIEQDIPMLEDFLDEAKHNLISAFSEVSSLSQTGIEFTLSANSVAAMVNSIIEECQEYVYHYCCRRWFLLRYTPKVEEYTEKVKINLDNLNVIIYAKKAPVREEGNAFNSGLIKIGEQAPEEIS